MTNRTVELRLKADTAIDEIMLSQLQRAITDKDGGKIVTSTDGKGTHVFWYNTPDEMDDT